MDDDILIEDIFGDHSQEVLNKAMCKVYDKILTPTMIQKLNENIIRIICERQNKKETARN